MYCETEKKKKIFLIIGIVTLIIIVGMLILFFKDKEKNIYIISFDSNGGTVVLEQKVKHGERIKKPLDPYQEYFEFVEWQLDGKKYDFNQVVTQDITLKAIWKPINDNIEKVTIKFDSNGGSKINNQIIEKGKKVTVPNTPSKSGYIFVEWQLDGKKYDFNQKVTKDITLKAIWNKIVQSKLYGDVNLDGKVTQEDATALLKYTLFPEQSPLTEQGKLNGDVNLDNKLTAEDSIIIENYVNKKQGYETLPYTS